MGKIPIELRETIARNIRDCRMKKFPGHGGGRRCAKAFGVTPQQWSPWESGRRTPDEMRLAAIAAFFGTDVEYLRRDHRKTATAAPRPEPFASISHGPQIPAGMTGYALNGCTENQPGSAASFYWLAHYFVTAVVRQGVRIDRQCIDYLVEKLAERDG